MAAEKPREAGIVMKFAAGKTEDDDDTLLLSVAAAKADATTTRESASASAAVAAIDEELNSGDDQDDDEEELTTSALPPSSDELSNDHVALFNYNLIEQVRDHPNLWNTKHPHYADYGRAIDAWEEIGRHVSQTPQECKRYFKYLRDHYVKLVRRKFELKLEGKECESGKPWQHYDQMAFLNSTIKFRRANMVGVGYVGGSEFSVRNDRDELNADSGKIGVLRPKSANEKEKRKHARKRSMTKNLEGDYLNELYLKLLNPSDARGSTPPEKNSSSEIVCQVESSTSNDYLGRLVEDTIKNLHPSLQVKGRLSIKKLLCELEEKSLRIYEQQRQHQLQEQPSPKVNKRRKMYNHVSNEKPSTSNSKEISNGYRSRAVHSHNSQMSHLLHNTTNVVIEQSVNSQNGFMVPVKNDSLIDEKDQLYAVSFLNNTN
uniref:MADF domain-containing protein n=1 Tax=Romanomermis culicivorax TaxID=13658 RepID=A0A915HW78_ROMCU